ncbi:hypothetical protein [Peribacillus sp. SI8-4]|uniref:hypothetical protein n=1 Tax=Peribacillus sp. SI8-4 TaxID=3048009 RepID=UPI002552C1B1|nr:hypothetical protein [Peribacillus sp. SI8-4]
MEWVKPYEDDDQFEDNLDGSVNFNIKKFIPEAKVAKKYSILTEFFLLLGAQHCDAVTSLYVPNKIDKQVVEEIMMHFYDTKVVLENGLPTEIMLRKPNQESLTWIRTKKTNPIIKGLFGSSNKEYVWKPVKLYKVLPEYIAQYDDPEFDKVLECLKHTSPGPTTTLSLSSWTFKESLKENLAIRYLAHTCKNLCLYIDDENNIIAIKLDFY